MKCPLDSALGPILPSSLDPRCRNFDFTVRFGDAFLTLAPNAIVLPFILCRGWVLVKRASVVKWPLTQVAKGVS